ncbi:hypothetical protein ACFW6K_12530 [Streptomyces sp. NPDC058733]|jgi:hypothetical protein
MPAEGTWNPSTSTPVGEITARAGRLPAPKVTGEHAGAEQPA